MKFRDVRKRLRNGGWRLMRTRGDHEQWTNPTEPGRRVTVAGHDSKEVAPKTLRSIFKQAGWK